MDVASFAAFNVTLLAVLASPGPALPYVLRNALTGDLARGMATGAGLGLMAATWTGIALLGLDAVFTIFPWAYAGLKIIGAGYLLWLAWTLWMTAAHPISACDVRRGNAFLGGILVNFGNPKSVLFASAVLVVIFPDDLTGFERSLIILNQFVVELAFYSTCAAVLAIPVVRQTYPGARVWLDRCAAVVPGVLGLRLLFQRQGLFKAANCYRGGQLQG
ncbi:MAG: LysE family translocator [Rhodobacteraceae bacterium]|nr:LysE family translocator [Paracoccaceae bacterium]